MVGQVRAADQFGQRRPDVWLDDHVDVVVRTATLCPDRPPWLTAAGRVAGSGDLVGEVLVGVLAERAVREPLLVAQLHPAQVEYRLLHGDLDTLPAAGVRALVERGHDSRNEVD